MDLGSPVLGHLHLDLGISWCFFFMFFSDLGLSYEYKVMPPGCKLVFTHLTIVILVIKPT
jgi:hypothetical protein